MSDVKRSSHLTPGVAFITGGARGLGNAIAVSFAQDGARAVVLVDIQDEATFAKGKGNVEAHGAECLAIHADVTKEEDIERAVAEAVKKFGRIDYAANFAGITGSALSISDLSLDAWEKVMGVNSTGVVLSTKHELRQMKKQSSIDVDEGRIPQAGSIVNCASVNSIQANVGAAAYTASKHAVAGITKVAALEGREHNIRVNSVSPGFLYTQMIDEAMKKHTGEGGAAAWNVYQSRQGRKATPNEIGDVVVLLSTPRMSLVNGHNLVIDNGFTINEWTS